MLATEKRLIYLDEAIARIKDDGILGSGYSDDERIDDVCDMLECCHTVDAVEVVHGQWIVKHNPITDPKGYFIRIVCSQCDLHTGQKSNYCPQCGAKMDGERKDK